MVSTSHATATGKETRYRSVGNLSAFLFSLQSRSFSLIPEAPSPRQRKRVSTADLEVSPCALLHGRLGVKPNGKSGVFLEEHSSVLPSFLPAASSFKTSLLQRQVLEQVWPARTALTGNKGWKMESLNKDNKLGRLPRRFCCNPHLNAASVQRLRKKKISHTLRY